MPGTTSLKNLRYAQPSDPPDIAGHTYNLAQDVDVLLGAAENIGGSADLNSLTEQGRYTGFNLTNAPTSDTHLIDVVADGPRCVQTAHRFGTTKQSYVRYCVSGTWTPWVSIAYDTGWISSSTGITAATDFSFTSAAYRIVGSEVSLSAVISRTGATVSADSRGKLPTTAVVMLPSFLVPSRANGTVMNSGTSSTGGPLLGYASQTGQSINMTRTLSGSGIVVSDTIDLFAKYTL